MNVYDDAHKISDINIKKAFEKTRSVKVTARPFNHIAFRSIGFDELGWWLPLLRVLPLIGITPQMLRPVFNPQKVSKKRLFPFCLRWWGLNKWTHKLVEVELPRNIESYKDLGCFVLSHKPYQELAKILGKPVEVWREKGKNGNEKHNFLFIAYPNGDVFEK